MPAYTIYEATPSDAVKLWYLWQLTGQPRLRDQVVIAEIQGVPVAAISVADGRLVVDPARAGADLDVALRSHAQSLRARSR